MLPVALVHRRQGEKIGLYRQRILVGDPVKLGYGNTGK
jgi:hypothetical protein